MGLVGIYVLGVGNVCEPLLCPISGVCTKQKPESEILHSLFHLSLMDKKLRLHLRMSLFCKSNNIPVQWG
jgi:hypothetical protein